MSDGWTRSEVTIELIDLAKHDATAFGEIYDLYADRIHAFCRVHSASREEAEDLMAQTFERALAAINRYQHRGIPFSAWLFRIAGNLAIDRARRSQPVVHLDERPDVELESPASNQVEQWVDRWQRAEWLREHLGALPIDQQRA
ncbi:MAG: RNA polymerase sigma factor, partial [Chloroflexota bacterium]